MSRLLALSRGLVGRMGSSVLDPALVAGMDAAAARALADWAELTECEIMLDHWVHSGRSGAVVAVVMTSSRFEGAGKLLLKLVAPGRGPTEYTRHRRALIDAPGFAGRFLTEPAGPPVRVGDGRWITFQRIAGGGLSDLVPASELSAADGGRDVLVRLGRAVTETVLGEWAAVPFLRERIVREFLHDQWDASLPIADLAAAYPDERLKFPGEPDPLASPFLAPAGGDRRIAVLAGPAHGDLHLGNILCSSRSGGEFRLVDLALYAADAPLARDPVHLALSIARTGLADLSPAQRTALIHLLTGQGDAGAGPAWLVAVLTAIRDTACAWAARRGLLDEWREQTRLSLRAAGLIFAARPSTRSEDRSWFVHLAARAWP